VRQNSTGRRALGDPVCRLAVLGACGWFLFYVVLTALSQDSPGRALFVGDILYLVPIAGIAVAASIAARRLAGRHRLLWSLLAVAFTSQLCGEALWAAYDYLSPDGPPEPGPPDVFYLTASTVTIAAVLVGFGGAGRLRQLRGLLDTVLIILSLSALAWHIFIHPQAAGEGFLPSLLTTAYPLLDVALLSCLVFVGVAGHQSVPLSVRLVGLAGAINAVSDMAYSYLQVFSEYLSGGWVDVAFELSACCSLVAAVVAIRMAEAPAERRPFDRGLTLLPIATSTVTCFTLVIYEKVRTGTIGTLTLVVVGVLFLTALLRQYLFAADRAALAEQLQRAVREQERLAVTDGLTGLYNRRFLMEKMSAQDDHVAPGPVSLVLVDLDHFKSVNDTWGHLTGDTVLREAASRIAGVCRATDVAARYGGEEFVVLLLDTAEADAYVFAQRLRGRLSESPVVDGSTSIRVTASIGVCTSRLGDTRMLLAAADEALYRAKAEGRDRVVVAASGAVAA
jgi:diguanylate cyclase (GGDEF)-like protein